MYLLLYADDTIIMAESECELRTALDAAHHYFYSVEVGYYY